MPQAGHFDHSDRLFASVAGAWRSATQASHDVKELVPEFFCNPGFLANASGLPLGTTQAGYGGSTQHPHIRKP